MLGAVKPWPAKEADSAVQVDQGGRAKVADNAMVFDRLGHASPV
jgi:hypothetical protein